MAESEAEKLPSQEDMKVTFIKEGIVIIDPEEIKGKTEIGRGGYGKVFKGKLQDGTDVVTKIMQRLDNRTTQLSFKEIRFLGKANHPNLAHLHGATLDPLAPVMSFVAFDLEQLGVPEAKGLPRGNNLGQLMDILHSKSLVEALGVRRGIICKAAMDVARGLNSLHAMNTCHRDLKPGNVLVGNQGRHLVCKLTDFGEARSPSLQTAIVPQKVNRDVLRGTTVFLAPEQTLGTISKIGTEGLKKVDVWAYGLIVFCIINPDLNCPWAIEYERGLYMEIHKAMKDKRLPESGSYRDLHKVTRLGEVYEGCCQYDPKGRLTMAGIMDIFLGHMQDRWCEAMDEKTPATKRRDSGAAPPPAGAAPPPAGAAPAARHSTHGKDTADRDMDTLTYRNRYPGKVDDPNLRANLDFYTNARAYEPHGKTIEVIHQHWFGDYNLLSEKGGYIQWLFPIREPGRNRHAQELQLHEAEAIQKDAVAKGRVLTSYKMMLDFFGFRLLDASSGELDRAPNWNERVSIISQKKYLLVISRMLKSLGELGFEHLKAPFVSKMLQETTCGDKASVLSDARQSCVSYWLKTLRDEDIARSIQMEWRL